MRIFFDSQAALKALIKPCWNLVGEYRRRLNSLAFKSEALLGIRARSIEDKERAVMLAKVGSTLLSYGPDSTLANPNNLVTEKSNSERKGNWMDTEG